MIHHQANLNTLTLLPYLSFMAHWPVRKNALISHLCVIREKLQFPYSIDETSFRICLIFLRKKPTDL